MALTIVLFIFKRTFLFSEQVSRNVSEIMANKHSEFRKPNREMDKGYEKEFIKGKPKCLANRGRNSATCF